MSTVEANDAVHGAWQTVRYVVNGTPSEIDGVLLFVDGQWSTLYFVPGSQGPWGSGEAGRYELDGSTLAFHHRLMFQGGGGRPLHLTQQASHVEACPISVDGGTLTIHFPSGNTLLCRRLPRNPPAQETQ
jgi:hypothetical protein